MGGTERKLADGYFVGGSSWAPDSKFLAIADRESPNGPPSLYRIAAENGERLRLTTPPNAQPDRLTYAGDRVTMPAIARSGSRLAYNQSFEDTGIWQVEPRKPARSFLSSTRHEYAAQYSPDGSRVVFSSDRSGQTEIWTCNADGRNLAQLTNFAEHSGTPRWSPDGRSIAFDRGLKEGFRIFVMASDGGQPRRLTSDERDEVIPSWSRDGNWIYYASNRSGHFQIWKAPAKGGKEIQVTRNGGWTAFESYDGKSLYYTKDPGDHGDSSRFGNFPCRADKSAWCSNPSALDPWS